MLSVSQCLFWCERSQEMLGVRRIGSKRFETPLPWQECESASGRQLVAFAWAFATAGEPRCLCDELSTSVQAVFPVSQKRSSWESLFSRQDLWDALKTAMARPSLCTRAHLHEMSAFSLLVQSSPKAPLLSEERNKNSMIRSARRSPGCLPFVGCSSSW